jgi:restriction endonuclease
LPGLTDIPAARRFVKELLRNTLGEKAASLDLLSTYASCSKELSEKFASDLGIPINDGNIKLSRESRLDLAISEANRGFLHDASKFLEWRDFERFAERCLSEMGFETDRDVRIKAEGRGWQIDVTGIKDQMLICLDCKHWASPMSPSRFKGPEDHQSTATRIYAQKLAKERGSVITSLPLILTLFEPHQNFSERTVIVEVQRLPSLLQDLTPYTPGLPFVIVDPESGENPISNDVEALKSQ